MSDLAELYRKHMPMLLRYRIGQLRTRRFEKEAFRRLQNGEWSEQYPEECRYMLARGRIETFPYPWAEAYRPADIEVLRDETTGLSYVLVEDRKLYFPRRYPDAYIRPYMNSLLTEQDPRSAHYYFDPTDELLRGTCFVDVGAAEGFIAMRVLPYVDHLVLIEQDPDWAEALEQSFAPWKDRVRIVRALAGETFGDGMTTIDALVSDENKVVLKLDVEGMEAQVLRGAGQTLAQKDTQAYVCTYHHPEDAQVLTELLKPYGFHFEQSEGVMFYGTGDAGFRKGILRARRAANPAS